MSQSYTAFPRWRMDKNGLCLDKFDIALLLLKAFTVHYLFYCNKSFAYEFYFSRLGEQVKHNPFRLSINYEIRMLRLSYLYLMEVTKGSIQSTFFEFLLFGNPGKGGALSSSNAWITLDLSLKNQYAYIINENFERTVIPQQRCFGGYKKKQ